MDLQKKLMQIGFTEYEAKVYLAMLSLYPATGYQLSKESGVPRSMVYESLKRLHARGAALETMEGRATVTRNADLVMVARQFVWMEMFTQRIYSQIGSELLEHLVPEDRQIFEALTVSATKGEKG